MKSKFKIALVVVAAAAVGYGVSRAQGASSDVEQFRHATGAASFGGSEDYDKLAGVIERVPKSPALTKEAIRAALFDEIKGKGTRADVVLISQNAQLIEQNKQIIALLGKIAAKK